MTLKIVVKLEDAAFTPAGGLIPSSSMALKIAVRRFGFVQSTVLETPTQCRMPPGCFY
jgi:hypothetical protein